MGDSTPPPGTTWSMCKPFIYIYLPASGCPAEGRGYPVSGTKIGTVHIPRFSPAKGNN